MEYKDRTYREHLQEERWYSFTVAFKETDLWIGIDKASFHPEIPVFTETRVRLHSPRSGLLESIGTTRGTTDSTGYFP